MGLVYVGQEPRSRSVWSSGHFCEPPDVPALAGAVAMVQQANPLPNRFKVLLANEQEGWHQTVCRLLEPQGVQTLSARSGREALELIESTPVHVAVLDAQMPQLGGMQVIRLMREVRRGDAPPAILLANDLNSHL